MAAKRPPSFAPSTCWNSTEGICDDVQSRSEKAYWQKLLHDPNLSLDAAIKKSGIVLNQHYEEDGAAVYRAACQLGCEGIVSKRLGSIYRRGRSPNWIKVKNPNAPAVKREA